VVVNAFLTFATEVLNHFAEGSQSQIYDSFIYFLGNKHTRKTTNKQANS